MTLFTENTTILKKFGKYSIVTGFLLLIVGTTGAILPELMALEANVFIAFFMLVGGIFWATHTFQYSRHSVIDWLKPIILLIVSGMMLYSPEQSIAALGLFLSFYLMMDAFSSFSIAQAHYPAKGWAWMFINGIMSVLLSIVFLVGWPQSSLWLVGLFVAISLIFDGISLIVIGWSAKEI